MQYFQTPDGQEYAVAGDDDFDFAIGGDDDFLGDDLDFAGDFLIGDDDDEDDFFGDDMLLGDDDDDYGDDDDLDPLFGDDFLIGAARKNARRRHKAAKSAILKRLKKQALVRAAGGFGARSKPVVRQGYKLTLPFSQAFTAGQTANITLTPQRSFRLTQLVVPDTISSLFQLNSLSVGQDNQFIAAGALNMEVFSNLSAQQVALKGSTANLGTTIVLNATNLDGANPQTLSGMLMGPTILQVA